MKDHILLAIGLLALARPTFGQSAPLSFSPTLTLSDGQCAEVIPADTLRRIGRHAYSTVTGRAYRFSFQGQEKDYELHDPPGTSSVFEYRMHHPRAGRFLSIDPLAGQYPHNSPYAFSENRVIDAIELEGLECNPLNYAFGDGGLLANWSGFDRSKSGDQNYQRQFAAQQLRLTINTTKEVSHDMFVKPIQDEPRLAILAAPLLLLMGPEIAVVATTDVTTSSIALQGLDMTSEFVQQYVANGLDAGKTDVADVLIQGLPNPWLENGLQAAIDYTPFDWNAPNSGLTFIGGTGEARKNPLLASFEFGLGGAQGASVKGLFSVVPNGTFKLGTEKMFDLMTGTVEKQIEEGVKQINYVER
jgi:hypothetical protein